MLNLGFWVVGGNKYWVSFVNNYLYCWSLENWWGYWYFLISLIIFMLIMKLLVWDVNKLCSIFYVIMWIWDLKLNYL